VIAKVNKYMLFAGLGSVRIVKNCGKLAYKWVCLRSFGIELAHARLKAIVKNLTSERASNSDTRQRNMY